MDKCAGFVGIASELIECDSKYTGVVESLLGRIAVVRNMDDALTMAKKYANRFRIVTLNGQVIETGGAMTGGSYKREAGMLSRANELAKLTARAQELQEALSALEEQLTEARRAYDQVEYQLATAREERTDAEKEVLSQEGREKQYEIWLQAISDAAAATARELDGLSQREQSDRERRRSLC